MSNLGDADSTPVTSVRQLADRLAAGGKPKSAWRIGTEHEKFGFSKATLLPPPYEPAGIRALLGAMADESWQPILDAGQPIGLKSGAASVSLEPAGQFELSGGLAETLHETAAELDAHLTAVRRAADPLGIGFAPLGFHPTMTRDAMPWMPKGRYAIMRRYMPQRGSRGLDMMTRTCTVQVNLDFRDEVDMARKLRVSLALQPVATALFANSPFREGAHHGALSERALVWQDTDPDRTGMPPLFFEEDFGFERLVDWLCDVPMYFVARDGRYVDLAGRSFRDFLAGRLPESADIGPPTVGDFDDHVTTAFTDVRIKRFLEMRGADAGTPAMMVAQSAFWVGLLYDEAALAAADALVRRHPWEVYRALRGTVPLHALDTPFATGAVRDLARDAIAIAADGLRARNRDELRFIAPLQEIAAGAPTQAERWLERFRGVWRGDASRIWKEAAV